MVLVDGEAGGCHGGYLANAILGKGTDVADDWVDASLGWDGTVIVSDKIY